MSGSRLIVALDFATAAEAQAFAARVTPSQCRLKVGIELFTTAGPALVSELAGRGFDVFSISSTTTFRTRWRAPAPPPSV